MGYLVVPNKQNMPTCKISKMFHCADQHPFRWTNRKCTLLMANRMYVLPWPTDKGRSNVSTKYFELYVKKLIHVSSQVMCFAFSGARVEFLVLFLFPMPILFTSEYSQHHWLNFIAQNIGMKKINCQTLMWLWVFLRKSTSSAFGAFTL